MNNDLKEIKSMDGETYYQYLMSQADLNGYLTINRRQLAKLRDKLFVEWDK